MSNTINTTATIGTTSVKISEAQVNKRELIITNTGATVISLGIGAEAVANNGIVLQPTFTYSNPESLTISDEINVISSAAGGTVSIFMRID